MIGKTLAHHEITARPGRDVVLEVLPADLAAAGSNGAEEEDSGVNHGTPG